MTDERTFSQAELDQVIKERLERERTKTDTVQKEVADQLAALQAKHAAQTTEFDKVKEEASELPTLKRAKLVEDLAREHKLDPRLTGRITGDTKEEIEADIAGLKADLEALTAGGIPSIPGSEPAKPKRTSTQSVLDEVQRVNDMRNTRRPK